jgi:phenylacetate-CoA ligase
LRNWPILAKDALRQNPRSFCAEVAPRLFVEHTSGTTGKPVKVWKSRRTLTELYALSEVREKGWHGISRKMRWAMLGGQLVVPVKQRTPPFWVWNAPMQQLYMSSYHLSADTAVAYLDALEEHRVHYVWGYTSSLYALALEILRRGARAGHLRVAIANAEPVESYHRAAVLQAFGCPLRATYGMSENVLAASECPHGRLHLWPEVGIAEVIEQGSAVGPGAPGALICTGLLNEDMPLVRYAVGDRGTLEAPGFTCQCGRTLPVLSAVEGREDDVLITRDGRRIGRLDPVFKADLPLQEAQVEQVALDRLVVRYVPDSHFDSSHMGLLVARLRERVGDMNIDMIEVPHVPRTRSGKFRAVVCSLPREVKEAYGFVSSWDDGAAGAGGTDAVSG